MTAEQTTAVQQCGSSKGRAIVALARTMLDTIVRCHEAVLQDENETRIVICHVLRRIRTASAEIDATFQSGIAVEGDLEALLGFLVRAHEKPIAEHVLNAQLVPLMAAGRATRDSCEPVTEEAIANWFLSLSQELDAAHPQAAQMLRMRLLGMDSRQIAERLQLPPRLVRHVFHVIGSGYVV